MSVTRLLVSTEPATTTLTNTFVNVTQDGTALIVIKVKYTRESCNVHCESIRALAKTYHK